VVLVILTVAAFLVIRSAIPGRDPHRDPPPDPETIEAAMTPLGYRRVAQTPGWAEPMIVVDAVYAHCQADEACDGERGDLTHPTVGLAGASVTAVYLRTTASAHVCISFHRLSPLVTDPRWQKYVRAVAILGVLGPRAAGPIGGSSTGTSIDVERDGWRCLSTPRPELSPS
jgi:hypothetical protein